MASAWSKAGLHGRVLRARSRPLAEGNRPIYYLNYTLFHCCKYLGVLRTSDFSGNVHIERVIKDVNMSSVSWRALFFCFFSRPLELYYNLLVQSVIEYTTSVGDTPA